MVAALLRIPSDILRACRDTDVVLGPGLPPGQGTSQRLRGHGGRGQQGGGPTSAAGGTEQTLPLPRASCSTAQPGPAVSWDTPGSQNGPVGWPIPEAPTPTPGSAPTPLCLPHRRPRTPGFPRGRARCSLSQTRPGIPASRRPCPGPAAPAAPSRPRPGGHREPRPQVQESGGGAPLRPDRSGHIPGQAGPGAGSREPVTCGPSPPAGDTARPSPRVEPCGHGPSPPGAILAGERPHSPRGGAGAAAERTRPQPRTARPRDGTDLRGDPRWLLPAEPAPAGGGGPSRAPRALPAGLPRPRGRSPCPAAPARPRPHLRPGPAGPPRAPPAPPRPGRAESGVSAPEVASSLSRTEVTSLRARVVPPSAEGPGPGWARDGPGGRAPAAAPQRERWGRGWERGVPRGLHGRVPVRAPGVGSRGPGFAGEPAGPEGTRVVRAGRGHAEAPGAAPPDMTRASPQLRDFLLVYNRMTEFCFRHCVCNLNYRLLTGREVSGARGPRVGCPRAP